MSVKSSWIVNYNIFKLYMKHSRSVTYKLIMAVSRHFCETRHTPKVPSRSVQNSPKLSLLEKSRLRSSERRFLCEEVRGGRQFQTYTARDNMLGVVPEHGPPKHFPRYTPLPAITSLPEGAVPKPMFARQLTYTVTDPVYVKGPTDVGKFQGSLPEVIKRGAQKPLTKKKRLLNKRKSQEEVARELEERKRRIQEGFSRSVHGVINIDEQLVEAGKHINDNVKCMKGAFWVQF